MAALSDKTLRALSQGDSPLIAPFINQSVKVNAEGQKIASYGVSSYGYDLRAAEEFMVFVPPQKASFFKRLLNRLTGKTEVEQVIDWHNIDPNLFQKHTGKNIMVPPGGFLLTRSVERVHIPKDAIGLCIGKSTVARAGWNCLCTPIEPGWEGYITFEFQNTTHLPNMFYANEGVLQLVIIKGDQQCETSYADRPGGGGKYNNQPAEIVLPRT